MFGNLIDPKSSVSKQKQLDRNYSVLEALLTKPRTTYLARIRNPNPNMPDGFYAEGPLSLREYERTHPNPFQEAGAPASAAPAKEGAR